MTHKDDYNLDEKIKITFKGMPYYVMPRYRTHYVDNEYEKFSLQLLENNLGPDKVFLDIGAHYGAYSLYAAKAAGSKVIAIEPVTENFELLNDNVQLNSLGTSITTHNYAVSDKNGEAEFNIPWASDSAGFYEHPNAETIKIQKVEVRKIDDLVKGQVDVIKIDTEGHEISVLKGMKKTLKNNPQAKLIIELNPECLKRAGKSVDELLSTISTFNKEIFIVNEDTFTLVRLTEQLKSWRDYVAESGYANLFCIPKVPAQQYLLFVSHSPRMDGAERALVDQVIGLRRKGWLSHVIVPSEGPLREALIDRGIGNTVIDTYSAWVEPEPGTSAELAKRINYLNIRASAEIADIAERIKPTGIVNNTLVNPWGVAAARLNGLPLYWMIHEYGDVDHNLALRYDIRDVRKFVVRESDLVFTCSDAVRRSLVTGHTKLDVKIHTSYNLIEQDQVISAGQQSIDPPYSKAKGVLKLCVVGTIKHSKGQHLAIQAAHELKQKGVSAELLIIGEGEKSYVDELERSVKELGLSKSVHFLGVKKNPYPYIRAADAVLVCSNNEAFGRVAAEAMILSVPVIGSKAGGTVELIENNKTGLLFKPNDASDLTAKIQHLMKSDRKKLTAAAKARVSTLLDSNLNVEVMMGLIAKHPVDKVERAYRMVLSNEWTEAVSFASNEFAKMIEDKNQEGQPIAELKAKNKSLEARNEELVTIIHGITSSRSWKVTKPLRLPRYVMKKLKR